MNLQNLHIAIERRCMYLSLMRHFPVEALTAEGDFTVVSQAIIPYQVIKDRRVDLVHRALNLAMGELRSHMDSQLLRTLRGRGLEYSLATMRPEGVLSTKPWALVFCNQQAQQMSIRLREVGCEPETQRKCLKAGVRGYVGDITILSHRLVAPDAYYAIPRDLTFHHAPLTVSAHEHPDQRHVVYRMEKHFSIGVL